MYIEKLTLKNYRNYKLSKFEFVNGINILVGNNAQGKTNLLESIYYLALTKSIRNNEDYELATSKYLQSKAIIEKVSL